MKSSNISRNMEQNQNNQQNQFKCTGDCLNCRKLPNEKREQWQYCASQFTYNSMRMLEKMMGALASFQCQVDDLKARIEAIQNNEALAFDPTKEELNIVTSTPTTQEGGGA